jgi:hypothetical protein
MTVNTITGTAAQPPRGLHQICEDARRGQCDYCCAMPGEPCAFGDSTDPDGYHVARFCWARAHELISVLGVGVVLRSVADTPFTSATVIYDTVSGTEGDTVSAEARMVGEVRAVLAAFDWEHDDRQLALEAIERIVTGDDGQEDEPYCHACGSPAGIFLGHGDGWHHFRGEGTVASPVELFDADHAPEVAWRPAGRTS